MTNDGDQRSLPLIEDDHCSEMTKINIVEFIMTLAKIKNIVFRDGLGDHMHPKSWHCHLVDLPPNPGILANMVHKSAYMRLATFFDKSA